MSNDKKNVIFVEAKVMNISVKFQLYPLYGFCGDDVFNIFLQIQPFGCHGNQSNSEVWMKMICYVEDYSRNSSVKFLSK